MREPSFDLQQAHRWFAVEYNNTTWDFLGTSDRPMLSRQQDDPKGLTDWDVALIYDAAARAYDASGNKEKAEEYKAKAKEAGEEIQGDRDVFMATFKM